jgi:adenosylcobyric acid synthase
VFGICGGCQVLGTRIADPDGVEGGRPGTVEALGLLPFETVLASDKITARRTVTFPDDLPEPWGALRGATADGYEIRHGRSTGGPVWADGRVLATTVHGLLEDPDVVERLTGRRPEPVLEATFELLADVVEAHLDTGLLSRLVAPRPSARRG